MQNKERNAPQVYDLEELQLEATLGDVGVELQNSDIPIIDLSSFDQRREQISRQLWQAAEKVGFFQLSNHELNRTEVEEAFQQAEAFFNLSSKQKQAFPLKQGLNAGWEYMEQVRPSTGSADRKESFQITLPHMQGLLPSQNILPEFQRIILDFEFKAWSLGMKILSCFADHLGFQRNFFSEVHDRSSEEFQSTLRLLHYLPMDEPAKAGEWRAGAHTDFDCLTMVFQKCGQEGLQVCAGRDVANQICWSPVKADINLITCNIGDMLMRWSDDKLKSTLHRVCMPGLEESKGSRYSMAYFCQANKDIMIQGPEKKYQAISARDFLLKRIQANF